MKIQTFIVPRCRDAGSLRRFSIRLFRRVRSSSLRHPCFRIEESIIACVDKILESELDVVAFLDMRHVANTVEQHNFSIVRHHGL